MAVYPAISPAYRASGVNGTYPESANDHFTGMNASSTGSALVGAVL